MNRPISQAEAYAHVPARTPCCDYHAPGGARAALTAADICLYAARQNIRLSQLVGSWTPANQAALEADLCRAEEMRRRAVECMEGKKRPGEQMHLLEATP